MRLRTSQKDIGDEIATDFFALSREAGAWCREVLSTQTRGSRMSDEGMDKQDLDEVDLNGAQ